ncbi:hypothetical protein D9M70_452260 [compost metagenome]
MQAAGTLQQQVHRSQVGQQEIEIEIEGLLRHLRADQQCLAWSLPVSAARTEPFEHSRLPHSTLVGRIAGVEQQQVHILAQLRLQQPVELLGAVDRIDDHRAVAALLHLLQSTGGEALQRLVNGQQLNGCQRSR